MAKAAIFLLNKNIEKPNKTNEPPQQRDAAGQNNSPGRETDAPNNEGSSEDSAAKIIGRANYFPAVKRRAANERRSNGRTTKRSSGQARRTQNSEVKKTYLRARVAATTTQKASRSSRQDNCRRSSNSSQSCSQSSRQRLAPPLRETPTTGRGREQKMRKCIPFLCMYVAHVHVSVILRWREF